MATLLLTGAASAAANAIGLGKLAGQALLTGASIAGSIIDGYLFRSGQDQRVEGPRLGDYEITSSTEGNPIRRCYGRTRVGGELIWAAEFEERVSTKTEGGKGGGPKVTTTTYSYFATFAVAICEGEIAYLNRAWADGKELDLDRVPHRLYKGTETQTPDPAIEAVEGAGNVPAYRGVAYVVFDDLPIDDFGRRIPQLTFEVLRPSPAATVEPLIGGVDIIPSSTEFGYDPEVVTKERRSSSGERIGEDRVNNNVRETVSDWEISMDHLQVILPNCDTAVLVVAWFGTDLRCAHCEIKPKIDDATKVTTPHAWTVAGLTRDTADETSKVDGRPAYGGTPNDATVVRAIEDLKARGFYVMVLPFILMDVPDGNGLPDPYSDHAAGTGQAVYPWRGRITISPAIGYAGSPDKTATAAAQVSAFFGNADPTDVSSSGTAVTWSGGSVDDWGYRRFVLHNAHLAKLGGADGFLIGSEMVQMTSARSAVDVFPFVDGLVTLLGDCRAILGSGVDIGYAADWSEYHSYRPGDGSGDVYFHLDKLWSDANCDFVGIDNYLPLSDWRDGRDHLDYNPAAGHTTIYALDYLKSNIEGGEYYDWFYASAADREAQVRTAIVDALYGEPWIYRNKDLRGWWSSPHHDRPGGAIVGLIPNGHAPALSGWSASAGATVEAEPGTFLGVFKNAVRITDTTGNYLSSVNSADTPMVAGTTYHVRVYYAAGSTQGHRLTIDIRNGNGVFWSYVTGGDGALDVASAGVHLFSAVDNIDHGGGIYEARFDFTPAETDPGANWGFGPAGNVVGLDDILIAITVTEVGKSTTGWVPESKPFWFIELGCPALDKASNQPNVFYDPKSSESALPHFSAGVRDDVIQRRFLQAWLEWIGSANNPDASGYPGKMVDPDRVFIWAWDARPFPTYPLDGEAWADAPNWRFGHWLSARIGMVYVPDLMEHMASDYGFADGSYEEAYGTVDGYVIDRTMSLRDAWGQLALFCHFDLVESGDRIEARSRHVVPSRAALDDDSLVLRSDRGPVRTTRAQETEIPIKARLRYIDSERAYQQGLVEAEWLAGESDRISEQTLSVVIDQPRAQTAVDTWLADARAARETFDIAVMPSLLALEPADVVTVPLGGATREVRIGEIGDAFARSVLGSTFIETVLVAANPTMRAVGGRGSVAVLSAPVVAIMDLPLLREDDNPAAAYVAAHADPWPGAVAVYRSPTTTGFSLNTLLPIRAVLGETLTELPSGPTGIYDRATRLRVELYSGQLASVDRLQHLEGRNAFAIQNQDGDWEIVLAREVALVSERVYDLSMLIRGFRGTEHAMRDAVPPGARVVWLDGGGVAQLDMTADELGRTYQYRSGPAGLPVGDPTYAAGAAKLEGVGLEPYAPVHVQARKDPAAGDVTISWVRRTRLGGDPWPENDDDVPLGEARESYRLHIEATDGTRWRTEADLAQPSFVWTAAMQTADAGGPASTFQVEVFQNSAIAGRGTPRRVTLSV